MKNVTISTFITDWEFLKNSYFWTPRGNSSDRKREEKRLSQKLIFSRNKHRIEAEILVVCSCKNYYVTKTIFVDGIQKNIRYLKKLVS